MLYAASSLPLPIIPWDETQPALHVSEVTGDARAVARWFSRPHVYYVGAHTGCGCGFNSGAMALEELNDAAAVMQLLDALTDEQRRDFLAEQDTRQRLSAYLADAGREAVELYACWSGDEAETPKEGPTVPPAWFASVTEPLRERALYRI